MVPLATMYRNISGAVLVSASIPYQNGDKHLYFFRIPLIYFYVSALHLSYVQNSQITKTTICKCVLYFRKEMLNIT